MISLKKCLFTLSFGVGMAVSLSAWAFPTCDTCAAWKVDCAGGDANGCYQYSRFGCFAVYGDYCPE